MLKKPKKKQTNRKKDYQLDQALKILILWNYQIRGLLKFHMFVGR